MRKLFAKITAWYHRGKAAKAAVREHLSNVTNRRFFTRISYRLDNVIIVCAAYRDHEIPLRTYHLFDPHTGIVRDVHWSEIRRLVPVRKSWC